MISLSRAKMESNVGLYNDVSKEVEYLKTLLEQKNSEIEQLKTAVAKCGICDGFQAGEKLASEQQDSLPSLSKLTERYGRQMILPEIGMQGQQRLGTCSALIVGAGGLGCPAGMYLAASGIGRLGVVDYDVVEVNNLHRQILHTEKTVGVSKCQSFVSAIKRLNSLVHCIQHEILLNSTNVADIIEPYTVIVDCSDNAPTRYLLNDACVFSGKPLVSGAALRYEGHLTVYNYNGGPCYRCLFPSPPAAGTTTNCSDGGVLGVVTGVIGSLQALEVLKLCTGMPPSYHRKLLLFNGMSGEFRTVKLREKKRDCVVCGENPTVKQFIDYQIFCQASATDKTENISLLSDDERVSCKDYKKVMDEGMPHVLLDVRPKNEVQICSLPYSVNIPFNELDCEQNLQHLTKLAEGKGTNHYIVCRRGNNSQRAVKILKEHFKNSSLTWQDLKGGLVAWHDEVDLEFPVY